MPYRLVSAAIVGWRERSTSAGVGQLLTFDIRISATALDARTAEARTIRPLLPMHCGIQLDK